MRVRLLCSLLLGACLLAQSGSGPKRIAWAVAKQNLVSQTPAQYPPLAQVTQISGAVIFRFIISDSGSVGEVSLIRGHPLLVNAALQAIRQWRFTPFTENGHAIPVTTRAEIRFSSWSPAQQQVGDQFFSALDACSVAYHDKQLDEAKHSCDAASQLVSELPKSETHERMDLSDQYGKVLLARNEASAAVAQFKNEVAIVKSFPTCESLDCALAHSHLASALQSDGQGPAAIPEYQDAEKILAKIVKSARPQMQGHFADELRHIYSEHAALLKQQGRSDAAAKVEDKAAALP